MDSVSPDAVRVHSKSQEKPPTTSSDGDESRRRRRRVITYTETCDDALEARHDGRGRVRAVRGDGNEAHVSMPFADGLLVGSDS